jgi:methylamine--corrinoid protein Co-methyltransferase
VAVVTAAYNPVDLLVLRGAVQHPFPTHFDIGTTSTRDTIWARNLATQAVTRHSTMPVANIGYVAAGPMTSMAFHEYAAWVIGAVVSGGSIEVGGSARGVNIDYTSPMEPLFSSALAHAVTGMSRKEANGIVLSLIEKFEDKLKDAPVGKRYQECYDVNKGTPAKEFIELHREVRQEMVDQFGLRLKRNSPYD